MTEPKPFKPGCEEVNPFLHNAGSVLVLVRLTEQLGR